MVHQKKKVGILTMYYTNISHGGLLQAYSLCKKIQEFGYDAEQIKYDYNERFRNTSIVSRLKIFVRRLPQTIMLKAVGDNTRNKYYEYMEEVPHSKLYRGMDMAHINSDYDIFVVGSDQVWNELYCDDYFYFPNVSKKKVAYAASVGRDSLSKHELNSMSKKIGDFYAISVREKSFQAMLQEHSNINIDIVCDPVFLNDCKFWSTHATNPHINEEYVLVYLLGEDKNIKNKAIQLAKKTGKKVVTIPNVNLNAGLGDVNSSDIVCWNVGPREFLGLIKNAIYVFTDSFHCIAFSIIFNRNFYCFDRGGSEKKMNSRLVSILNIVGLADRFVDLNTMEGAALSGIDYKPVNEKLLKYKKESEEWLKDALSD